MGFVFLCIVIYLLNKPGLDIIFEIFFGRKNFWR